MDYRTHFDASRRQSVARAYRARNPSDRDVESYRLIIISRPTPRLLSFARLCHENVYQAAASREPKSGSLYK